MNLEYFSNLILIEWLKSTGFWRRDSCCFLVKITASNLKPASGKWRQFGHTYSSGDSRHDILVFILNDVYVVNESLCMCLCVCILNAGKRNDIDGGGEGAA